VYTLGGKKNGQKNNRRHKKAKMLLSKRKR
jgi:hypothetical protein